MKTRDKQDRVLVVGVGNSLRTDDGVGLYLCGLFRERFGELADVLEVYGPDILLSETVSEARRLLVIDAVAEGPPFRIVPLLPQETPWQPGPFTSHLFSWPAILAASRALYGKYPETELLAVRGYDFGIGFSLTPECKNNADKAFEDKLLFLTDEIR